MHGYDGINFEEELFFKVPNHLHSVNVISNKIFHYDIIKDDVRTCAALNVMKSLNTPLVHELLTELKPFQEIYYRVDEDYIWNFYFVVCSDTFLSKVHHRLSAISHNLQPCYVDSFEPHLQNYHDHRLSMVGFSLTRLLQFEMKLFLSKLI